MIHNTKSGCEVTGPLIRDPETREVGKGSVTKFAVRYDWEEPEVEGGRRNGKLLDVDAWGDLGDALVGMGVHKGDVVQVVGEIKTREYNGKTYRSLNADAILLDIRVILRLLRELMAPPTQMSGYNDSSYQPSHQDDFTPIEDNDDLPF